MSTSSKSKLSVLRLVYAPLSNQEATWIQDDPEVERRLRESDFYVIGGRAEVTFSDFRHDREDGTAITFSVSAGGKTKGFVALKIGDLPRVAARAPKAVGLELGNKLIRIWSGQPHDPGSELLEWFTTEKLLMERWRGMAGIYGLDDYRDFATYDLLYVGIAKVGDSYDRLIAQGHKARQEILSNESQRYPGSRVADEIYLFMFKIEPIIIHTFSEGHEFTDADLSGEWDQKRFVADAEKAFVSLLKPQYNVIRFKSYPRGDDGLYGSDYVRYGYAIAENLSFNTAHGWIRGGWDSHYETLSNDADCIFVEGDVVKLYVSGVDFPATRASGSNSDPRDYDIGESGLAQESEREAPHPSEAAQAPEPEN